MSLSAIEDEKKMIEKRKKKILIKEKLIREKEKQALSRKLSEIGKIAQKAKIDQIDKELLFGAFLEIAEKNQEEKNRDNWEQKTKTFLKTTLKDSKEPLIISFSSQPTTKIESLLKKMNFKWNKFRKEFYGYGHKKTIQEALAGTDFKIEIAE